MEQPFRNPQADAYALLDAIKTEPDAETVMRMATEAAAYAALASTEASLALRDEVESLGAKVRELAQRD